VQPPGPHVNGSPDRTGTRLLNGKGVIEAGFSLIRVLVCAIAEGLIKAATANGIKIILLNIERAI